MEVERGGRASYLTRRSATYYPANGVDDPLHKSAHEQEGTPTARNGAETICPIPLEGRLMSRILMREPKGCLRGWLEAFRAAAVAALVAV